MGDRCLLMGDRCLLMGDRCLLMGEPAIVKRTGSEVFDLTPQCYPSYDLALHGGIGNTGLASEYSSGKTTLISLFWTC